MSSLKRLYLTKFNTYILLWIALLNAKLVGLSVWKHTYYFSYVYLKFNIVQLSAIFIACFALFYISYKKVTKKNPDLLVIIAYLLSFSLFSYYLINISMLLERVTHRGGFGLSNSLFINTALICFGLMLSNFDLPTIDSFRKGFFSIKENIYKYLGVILTLCFVIAYIGLVNTTFIYVISIIPVFINLYLLKIWLSNIRK